MDTCYGENVSWNPNHNLPGVAVACREAHEAVGQVILVHKAAQLASLVRSVAHSLVVVSNNGLSDQGSEVVLVVPADTLHSNGNIGGRDGVVAYPDIGTDEFRLLLGQEVGVGLGRVGGQLSKVLVGHLYKLLVGDATSANKHHAVSSVVVLDVVGELGSGDISNVLPRTQDGTAERLVLEGGGMQVVENDLLDLLLDLLGLAQDHVTLALDSGLLELGVLEDIGEDIDTLRHILIEGLGKVDGVFTLNNCQKGCSPLSRRALFGGW